MEEVNLVSLDLNNSAHVNWMFEVRAHPDVVPYFFSPPPLHFSDHLQFLTESISSGEREFFIVALVQNMCGYCQLIHHQDSDELGFAIHPKWWGHGIGKASVKLLLDYVQPFQRKIILHVKSNNIRAINLYQKFGFSVLEKKGQRYLMIRGG